MCKLKLETLRADSIGYALSEHEMVFMMTNKFNYLFRHLCDSAGLLNNYENGNMDESDLNGKIIVVIIDVFTDKKPVFNKFKRLLVILKKKTFCSFKSF